MDTIVFTAALAATVGYFEGITHEYVYKNDDYKKVTSGTSMLAIALWGLFYYLTH